MKNLIENLLQCKRCHLHKYVTQIVPPRWTGDPKLMFIGEAPGRNEDISGKPFVGSAGRYFEMISGLLDIDYYVTNTIKCRPTENNEGRKNRKPSDIEVRACSYWLRKEIKLLKPRIIVLLGNVPLQRFYTDYKISDYHGKVIEEKDGIIYFALYHPAVLVYSGKNLDVRNKYFTGVENLKNVIDKELV